MSSASPVAPLEQPPLSQAERVVDTFIAPSKTFTDIRRSASWWVPWILLAIASVAMVMVVDKKLGMEKVVENQMALSPKQAEKLDQLSPDQRASQIQTIVKVNRAISYAYPVLLLIIVAIMAGVLLGTFNFGFGQHLTFNQCMAISLYASLPGIIKALIAILAISVGGGEGFTFQNPVASNLGALVDPSSHFLYSIATSLDVFTIWVIALAGLRQRNQAEARNLHGRGLRLVGSGGAGRSGICGIVRLRMSANSICASLWPLRERSSLHRVVGLPKLALVSIERQVRRRRCPELVYTSALSNIPAAVGRVGAQFFSYAPRWLLSGASESRPARRVWN